MINNPLPWLINRLIDKSLLATTEIVAPLRYIVDNDKLKIFKICIIISKKLPTVFLPPLLNFFADDFSHRFKLFHTPLS
jgi:hypothetical protein